MSLIDYMLKSSDMLSFMSTLINVRSLFAYKSECTITTSHNRPLISHVIVMSSVLSINDNQADSLDTVGTLTCCKVRSNSDSRLISHKLLIVTEYG